MASQSRPLALPSLTPRRNTRESSRTLSDIRRPSRQLETPEVAENHKGMVRFIYSESVTHALRKYYDCYWFEVASAKHRDGNKIDIQHLNDIYEDYIAMRALQVGAVCDARAAIAAREKEMRAERARKSEAAAQRQRKLQSQTLSHRNAKLPPLNSNASTAKSKQGLLKLNLGKLNIGGISQKRSKTYR